MHVAAAFGVPVVAVFGPTDHRTTFPLGPGHAVVREPADCSPCMLRECPIDHRCMTRVTVDKVYAAAAERLDGRGRALLLPSSDAPLKGVTIFLDRDGTLNRDLSYIRTPEELELLPGAAEAVARLKQAGATLVLITNQSGVARGFITIEVLKLIHARLLNLLDQGHGSLDAIYFCPHHPEDGCLCRKPQTGMVDRARVDLGLDLSPCYVVGDQSRDVEVGRRIGARTVLVMTGPTSPESLAHLKAEGRLPDYVAADLAEAASWILEDAAARKPGPVLPAPSSEALA
jgi:heptosyltransferase-2